MTMKIAATVLFGTLLLAGAAVAAEGCCDCCEEMQGSEPMACCDDEAPTRTPEEPAEPQSHEHDAH